MARIGSFDPLLRPAGWFDQCASPEGLFDADLVRKPAEASNAYELDAQPGVFVVTGDDATLERLRRYELDAQPGAFALSGADAGFARDYVLEADVGAFALAGADAGLRWSGEPEEVPRRDTGAGRGKKDRPARRRRKVVIGDEVYWASEAELPALLQALLTQPEAPPASPREARKRARRRAKAQEAIPVAKIAEVAPQRRPEALARLFEAVGEDILLRSLQIAVANLAEQDDEEVLLLTL